jgi:hypothetical protein
VAILTDFSPPIVKAARPQEEDYLVLKSILSGFLSPAAGNHVAVRGAKTLMLKKFATDNGVLFAAVETCRLILGSDCLGAQSPAHDKRIKRC